MIKMSVILVGLLIGGCANVQYNGVTRSDVDEYHQFRNLELSFEQCAVIQMAVMNLSGEPTDKVGVRKRCHGYMVKKYPWVVDLSEPKTAYVESKFDLILNTLR